ncbi:MFS general substrate transporter [Pleurostoma richardsiae]|uniref:MFS general substrate transporter n=1 Tax=Pleurostoma richardsiae TaxID=41990 RepID=A0AA38RCQ7_9PEZI|nr:MFS general substrate transporter [Pleurostoma richardsiae]
MADQAGKVADKTEAPDIETAAPVRAMSINQGEVKNLVSSDYDEYLGLQEVFQGERLEKLTRKIDIRILPQLILLYLLCYIDRSNAGNVKLFGALDDLKLSGQDWNTAMCVFFATYSLGGVPSNIALKRLGPNLWLPILLTVCGLLDVFHGLLNNMAGLVSLRLLLGLVEAGVYPGCSYVLTSWYAPEEVHRRMTVFYSGASLATAFSGLLAYAIGHLDHTWGYRGWRFIYVIEGLLSICVGLIYFFVLCPSPEKASGWLTEEEKRFLVLRNRFARIGNSGVGEDEKFSWKHARESFRSFHVYSVGIIEFTVCVVVYGISFVLPTVISLLGYSALKAQAMTAPPYVFACVAVFFSGWAADRYQKRMLAQVIPNIVACVGLVIIIASVRYSSVPGVTYLGIFFMAAGLQCLSPATMAWIALNQAGDMKRGVSMAIMVSIGQLGGIVGSNIFLAREAPVYSIGFGICLGMLVVIGVIWPVIYWAILKRINAQRDRLSIEEIAAAYTEEDLADMGDRSPLFRYAT